MLMTTPIATNSRMNFAIVCPRLNKILQWTLWTPIRRWCWRPSKPSTICATGGIKITGGSSLIKNVTNKNINPPITRRPPTIIAISPITSVLPPRAMALPLDRSSADQAECCRRTAKRSAATAAL